ncbi:hypothetical protein [Kibdelosporangium philippinense]
MVSPVRTGETTHEELRLNPLAEPVGYRIRRSAQGMASAFP